MNAKNIKNVLLTHTQKRSTASYSSASGGSGAVTSRCRMRPPTPSAACKVIRPRRPNSPLGTPTLRSPQVRNSPPDWDRQSVPRCGHTPALTYFICSIMCSSPLRRRPPLLFRNRLNAEYFLTGFLQCAGFAYRIDLLTVHNIKPFQAVESLSSTIISH